MFDVLVRSEKGLHMVFKCSFKNTVFYLLKCRLYILMKVNWRLGMRIRSYSHFLQIIYKIVYIS